MPKSILEICAASVASAVNAQDGWAGYSGKDWIL